MCFLHSFLPLLFFLAVCSFACVCACPSKCTCILDHTSTLPADTHLRRRASEKEGPISSPNYISTPHSTLLYIFAFFSFPHKWLETDGVKQSGTARRVRRLPSQLRQRRRWDLVTTIALPPRSCLPTHLLMVGQGLPPVPSGRWAARAHCGKVPRPNRTRLLPRQLRLFRAQMLMCRRRAAG